MANPEHLAILKKGVEAWNQWRVKFPDTVPDLSYAHLRDADLSYAHLRRAHLHGAILGGAILSRADLRYADLRYAHLNGANLTATDFDSAIFSGTTLGAVYLSQAQGLETVKHHGPSTIGIDTLALSKGAIPEIFLRGCGLLNWEIEAAKLYAEALTNLEVDHIVYRIAELRYGQALQFYSVFLSYSTQDQRFAQKLYDDLQKNSIRCWFAPHQIQGGKKILEQLERAIQFHDRLLLILSEHSMSSRWVKTEIANARRKEAREHRQVLFPIRLVDFERIRAWKLFDADLGDDSAGEIREYFIPDFSHWEDPDSYQEAWERLLQDLRAQEAPAHTQP